ncbi:hypothetical protein C5167_016231 [Papaver somniferum]|nr:hypothetical protein C5167_016231 [Papaver somniferum]
MEGSGSTTLFPLHRTKTLHLVRHAHGAHQLEVEDRDALKSEELFDAQLSLQGWQQVDNLNKHINECGLAKKVELVIVSPLLRTMQTAVGAFGGVGDYADGTDVTPLMVENAGNSNRSATSNINTPPFLAVELCRERLIENEEDVLWKADARESYESLAVRGMQFIDWLWTRKEKEIAVVTHSCFLFHTLGAHGKDYQPTVQQEMCTRFANCELRSVVIADRGLIGSGSGTTNYPGKQQKKLLQACSGARYLDHASTKLLHALSITMDWSCSDYQDPPILTSINNSLITAYASQGELSMSMKVFDTMPERNVVLYNSIISAYSRNGHDHEERRGDTCGRAWQIFNQMRGLGINPTQFTFGSLLTSSSLNLIQGLQLLPLTLKTGLLCSDAFSGTALLGLFGRLGRMDEAYSLFQEMPKRRIGQGSQHLSSIGGQIHGLVKKIGLESYTAIANSLLNMYAKFSLGAYSTEVLFEEMTRVRDVVSWNIIIGAFARSDKPWKAVDHFLTMSQSGFSTNQTTFANVISACTSLQISKYGEIIHAKTIMNGLNSDVFVGSALVDFYAKCDKVEEAHLVFSKLDQRSVVSWNALIAGYSTKGSHFSTCLLQQMLHLGYRPNEFSFSAALKSSLVDEVQQLHCLIVKMGYHQNEHVFSSLIASYAMNGLISDALSFVTSLDSPLSPSSSNVIGGTYNRIGQFQETQKLLFQVGEHDIISWNILIEACGRNGDYLEVFALFKSMQMAHMLPDNHTFMSLLSISGKLCNLSLGSSLHGLIIKMDFKCCDVLVCNVLLDMYAKCGSLESSVKIFSEMTDRRNLISWTSLVSALGLHGYAFEALKRFRELESSGLKLDRVCFIAVLSACRHGGLVEEGMKLFSSMKVKYGIEPDMDHYVCMVDLLSRSGHLREAERLINNMPSQPTALIWRIFLAGCKRCNKNEEQAVG